jgi:hypothetical protein
MSSLAICDFVSHGLPELGTPLPHRFVGDYDATFQHHLLRLAELSGNWLMISTGKRKPMHDGATASPAPVLHTPISQSIHPGTAWPYQVDCFWLGLMPMVMA